MIRLDKLMVDRGLVPSRARAVRLIESGAVTVQGEVVKHAATSVSPDVAIELIANDFPWVSRAGVKLNHALTEWRIEVKGDLCLDVGSSTGGFTQVLLERGAERVFAVDVGTKQLAPILGEDARVVVMEQTHILELAHGKIPRVDMIVIDLSFISLTKVIPHVVGFLKPTGKIVALIKPQFEVGKEHIAKGVVRDALLHQFAVDSIKKIFVSLPGFRVEGVIPSPITGGDGNVEFLIYVTKTSQ